MLVEVGETEGFAAVELKPDTELAQEYVLPATAVAPMEMVEPEQMAVLEITEAVGNGLTVMVAESVLLHPVEVFVSVRI